LPEAKLSTTVTLTICCGETFTDAVEVPAAPFRILVVNGRPMFKLPVRPEPHVWGEVLGTQRKLLVCTKPIELEPVIKFTRATWRGLRS
jgi:hypothetical protein